uniref:uncharacterized protein LOC120334794 n=1 Tax=Styela clava TaxID=7725 RepID=UPI00193A4D78|nr:uncharacterized protein LOC120334794 [Styela clava]
MDEILKCYSCGTKFETTGPKEPQVLPCQHTFCKVCIFKLVRTDSTKCPTCREVHPAITAARRNLIRTNLTIIRLLEEVPVPVPEVPENGTVYRTNIKLEMLKIYIVYLIMTIMKDVLLQPNYNVVKLQKPSQVLVYMILPFYKFIWWKNDMKNSPKMIILELLSWVTAIGFVTLLNFISPTIKQLVIRLLKAPAWKVGLILLCFAILLQYFPSQTKN